jgi:hypothetical protein
MEPTMTTSQTSKPLFLADISEQLAALRDRMDRAETAEEFAEIARLEAEALGGPFYCLTQ